MAAIHPRLLTDSDALGRYALCHVRLSRDANYPWLILVPDRDQITEIFQLDWEDQVNLMRESSHVARVMMKVYKPDKLNIAALGNVVPQLHLHHIARYKDDPAWPAPVWGRVPARAYDKDERRRQAESLCVLFSSESGWVSA